MDFGMDVQVLKQARDDRRSPPVPRQGRIHLKAD